MILILLAIYLLIYIVLVRFVTKLLMRIPKTTLNKRIVLGVCVFIAAGLPVWDVPWVHLHFNYLCKTQAGIHIYEEVLLGPEYWNEGGTLNDSEYTYYEKLIDRHLPKGFGLNSVSEYDVSRTARTDRWRWQIIRVDDQKIAGEFITINRGKGWFDRQMPYPAGFLSYGKSSCPDHADPLSASTEDLIDALFKPKFH